jgi:hypothetical protein
MTELLTGKSLIVFVVFPIVAWIIGHQSSHIAATKAGQVTLSSGLAFVMGLETFAGFLFLIWYGYQTRWYLAVILFCFSLLVRPLLVLIERAIGLTQRAWIISTSGIFVCSDRTTKLRTIRAPS